MSKRLLFIVLCLFACFSARAQEYIGTSGLVHVPSAEMLPAATGRIGTFFLNKEFTPDRFQADGQKYHTYNHFLSFAPFSWIEIAYTCTLMKGHRNGDANEPLKYCMKDRFFSVKLQPLKEGKWYPAIAVGTNDPIRSNLNADDEAAYFRNFYVAATKHFDIRGHELAAHLAYRYYTSDYNSKWRGVAGGITYRPSFAKNLRAIVEYTGNDMNIGVDCYLWKLIFLQASLQDGKYFSGGIMLQVHL